MKIPRPVKQRAIKLAEDSIGLKAKTRQEIAWPANVLRSELIAMYELGWQEAQKPPSDE